MPWKESDAVSERMRFVLRLEQGERMVDLCREFGISAKTGHKIKKRYDEEGPEGLFDRSRRPRNSPRRTPAQIAGLIIAARRRFPTWGPKKLRVLLQDENRGVAVPAASTIGIILEDAGLVDGRPRRRRASPSPTPLRNSQKPNDIWAMDFKGQFRLGDRHLCYPLTVTDHFSRLLLGCDALESTKTEPVRIALRLLFKEFGVPDCIRSDNGAPFASTGLGGFSKLSVWLMRVGVQLERIEPGHPEQNGRHERMHRDLKAEATTPPGKNILHQQERFDEFRATYNDVRPHEVLDMRRPSDIYVPASRRFVEPEGPLAYPLHHHAVRVYTRGEIFLPIRGRPRVHVGEAFVDQELGLRHVGDGTWLISFLDFDLGYVDEETRKVLPPPNGNNPPADRPGGEPSPRFPPPDLETTPSEEGASRV